jgi:hypothetical protein
MKCIKQAYVTISIAFCTLLIMGLPSDIFAQNAKSSDISDFLIVVETTDDEIKLTCKKGCAWKNLSFNITSKKEPQAIDQYGMAKLPRVDVKEDSKLFNFLITVEKTDDGLRFEGKEGTAWTKLSFNYPEEKWSKTISRYGVSAEE